MFQKLIKKYFKLWGVEIETSLPPEFIISLHAYQRLKERFPSLTETKYKKITIKAWNSKEYVRNPNTREYPGTKHRSFNGLIFVFKKKYRYDIDAVQKILVTVINPKT